MLLRAAPVKRNSKGLRKRRRRRVMKRRRRTVACWNAKKRRRRIRRIRRRIRRRRRKRLACLSPSNLLNQICQQAQSSSQSQEPLLASASSLSHAVQEIHAELLIWVTPVSCLHWRVESEWLPPGL